MEVVIQISPPAKAGESDQPVTSLRREVQKLGLKLEPVHPRTTDPVLATYYRVQAPDAPTAKRVVESVRRLPSISAAYVKPADEVP